MARKKYEETDGVWRTIRGRKVFIREGQTAAEAIAESKKNAEERPVAKKLAKQKKENKESIEKKKNNKQTEEELPDFVKNATPEEQQNYIENMKRINEMKSMGQEAYLLKKQRERGIKNDEKPSDLQDKANEIVEGMGKANYKKESIEKRRSNEQIEKDFPDNLSDEVKEHARILNTRGYDDVDDVIDDFAEEHGITRSEAKYALLKDEFKQRQETYMDAKTSGSYSDEELEDMEAMAKDSYFKLQETKEQIDSFNKENKTIQERYGLKDKRNEEYVHDYERGDIKQDELKDLLRRGGESEETIHGVVVANTGANSKDPKVRALFAEDKAFNDYLEKRGVSQDQYKFIQEMQKDWLDAEGYKGEINDFDKQGYARNIIEEYTADKKAGRLNGKTLEQYGIEWTNWGEGHPTPMPDKYKNILKGNGEWKTEYKSGMDLNTRLRENQEKADKIIADDEWNDITTSYQGNKASIVNERTGRRVKIGPYDTNETLRKKIKESYEERPVAAKLSKQAATRRYNRMPADRQKAVDDLMRKGGISRAEAISAADEFIKLVGETPGKSKEQMLEELMKRGYSRTTAEKMLRQRKRK